MILVALFQPMRKVVVSRIDGLFYLGATAHNDYLGKYTSEIAAAVDMDQVFRITKIYIQTVLNPSSYFLFIRRDTEPKFYSWDSSKLIEGVEFQQRSKTVALMETSHQAVYLPTEGKYDPELEIDRPLLDELDATILVPLNVEHELLGWFVLGPPQTGKPYFHRELVFIEELRAIPFK